MKSAPFILAALVSAAALPSLATNYECHGEHGATASFSITPNGAFVFSDGAKPQLPSTFNCPVPTFRSTSREASDRTEYFMNKLLFTVATSASNLEHYIVSSSATANDASIQVLLITNEDADGYACEMTELECTAK